MVNWSQNGYTPFSFSHSFSTATSLVPRIMTACFSLLLILMIYLHEFYFHLIYISTSLSLSLPLSYYCSFTSVFVLFYAYRLQCKLQFNFNLLTNHFTSMNNTGFRQTMCKIRICMLYSFMHIITMHTE